MPTSSNYLKVWKGHEEEEEEDIRFLTPER